MGQSICLSLLTKISAAKPKQYELSLTEIVEKINFELPTDLSLFNLIDEDEKEYHWTLQTKVLERDLLPFLEKFYPLYYFSQTDDYQALLKQLREQPSGPNWLKLAHEKYEFFFQYDDMGQADYFCYEDKRFRPTLRIRYEGIILALAGKIYLETHGGLLRFLGESVQLRFSEFPLAKCLKVYISG